MPTDEERIALLAPFLRWRPGPVTDPIGMELALERVNPEIRDQLVITRLEAVAAVYRTMADSAAKAAEIAGTSVKSASGAAKSSAKPG